LNQNATLEVMNWTEKKKSRMVGIKERHHQFGSQLCPHDLSFAVIEKLHDVSEDQEDQQQQHKHVDVDENEHDDCVGNGQPCPKTDDPGTTLVSA
jgi:hypothetical protein